MKKKLQTSGILILLLCFGFASKSQDMGIIQLPAPNTQGGKPLMETLKERQSSREFSNRDIPDQILSNLLWAAFGVNRPESGKRTAASAWNRQEVDIYVATSKAVYLYNAKDNTLIPLIIGDFRDKTGTQPFVKSVPVNLVFVADFARMGNINETEKYINASTSAGAISQNVYLFCASEKMATVVRGLIDKPMLSGEMKLRPDQKIILAQSVGYPKQ